MPGIDKYLEEQRKRLQSFGNFVGGINKPSPKPQGQTSSGGSQRARDAYKPAQPSSMYNTTGRSSRSRHSGRLRQAESRRRRLAGRFGR